MKIILARHHGMCFGVRDALRSTHDQAGQLQPEETVTVLGELIHNPVANRQLDHLGVHRADRDSNPSELPAGPLVITAHGVADRDRERYRSTGRKVIDTTCPLVHKAHKALALLVAEGRHPVIVGKSDHVEVRGLRGDFPHADVILDPDDFERIDGHSRIGIVSQTTQPIDRVRWLVESLQQSHPQADIRFIDTVCQPTKDRQKALHDLCEECDVIVAVGGRHSNNTRQLVRTARSRGCRAHQVESAADLERSWFRSSDRIGVTAGTSTLDETVSEVVATLRQWAAAPTLARRAKDHFVSRLRNVNREHQA